MKSCQIMVTNKQIRLNHRQFQLATCNMQQNIIDLFVCVCVFSNGVYFRIY